MEILDSPRNARVLVACLVTCLMILGQLAPLAPAASRDVAPRLRKEKNRTAKASANPALPTVAPLVPGITATQTDSFPDVDADGKAVPGETITYTATITNSGTDAPAPAVVIVADTVVSGGPATFTINPTTVVPGSLKVSPLAIDDIYVAAQSTPVSVGAPGVLTNDTGSGGGFIGGPDLLLAGSLLGSDSHSLIADHKLERGRAPLDPFPTC